MSDDVEALKKHMKVYFAVFGALAVLTCVTVGVSYIQMGTQWNITVALIIATIKASLVAAFFMHLASEKKMIYRVLIFTFIFLLGLMFLSILGWSDPILYHQRA
jgi:cytochrome c oxidase subunit 4